MNSKRLATIIFGLLVAIAIHGQNSIDRMVDNLSTTGGSTFTSAVERNPKTRKVERVVRRLNVEGPQAARFFDAFKRELQGKSNVTNRRSDDELTIIFTEESAKANRIYMLKSNAPVAKTDAVVTIIVRMK